MINYVKEEISKLKEERKVAVTALEAVIKRSHRRFFNELQKIARDRKDPYLMAAMMAKYSEKIEDIDPRMSINLLREASVIINV